jgi:secernin
VLLPKLQNETLCRISLFKVSVLSAAGSGKPHCHWFTATPNPQASVFKPFIFTPAARISQHTCSPVFDDDPAKVCIFMFLTDNVYVCS